MGVDAVPPEAQPAPGTNYYHGPVGGWGSLSGITLTERKALAGPGALETLTEQNKAGGFMCVSCAWAKPPNPGVVEFCENGAKATLWDLTTLRCEPEFFERFPVSKLSTWSEFDLERVGRLTHPMRYDATRDRYVPTSWEEAFEGIAAELKTLAPNSVTFYASGKASLETSFLYALFARAYGHNNLPDSSNMCHETTSVGLKQVIGTSVGACTLQDLDHCDAIFYVGQNPGTNSPRILHPLKAAVLRGCRIVVLNPLKEKGLIEFVDPQNPWQMTVGKPTPIAHQYIQVRPGGDIAALTGIAKAVLARDADNQKSGGPGYLDRGFLAEHTHGADELLAYLEATDWADIESHSGVTRAELESAADVYVGSKRVMGIYGMGVTQHVHGSQGIGALVNLLLLRGNIGRPGAGISPIRGHSNVQGQRTVGITEKPDLAPHEQYRKFFDVETPAEKGWNTIEFCDALLKGDAKGYIGLGGNLARAVPEQTLVAGAWGKMQLTVHIATRLNRTHLMPGKSSWLLPCLVRAEEDAQASGAQQVSMEDSFSHIYGSIGKRRPASSHLLSELAIVAGIAKATLPPNPKLTWDDWTADYRRVRKLIAEFWPEEFHDMEERMNAPGGFYRGNPAHERIWKTKSGKAEFTTPTHLDAADLEERPGRFRLITLRSNDQFNTTVYGLADRLRGLSGDRMIVMMGPEDIAAAGLTDGQRVTLQTDLDDGIERRAKGLKIVSYDLPRGALCGYFPELNVLAPLSRHDLASGTPAAKAIPVRIVA